MSDYQGWLLIISIAGIIFSCGGFVWIAKNHMRHAQASLDRLENRANGIEQRLSRIEGALNIHP